MCIRDSPIISQLSTFSSDRKIEVQINGNDPINVEQCFLYLLCKNFQELYTSDRTITKYDIDFSVKDEKNINCIKDLLLYGKIQGTFDFNELANIIIALKEMQCDYFNDLISNQIKNSQNYRKFLLDKYEHIKHVFPDNTIEEIIFMTADSEDYLEFFQRISVEEASRILGNENLKVFNEDQIIRTITNCIKSKKDASCLLNYAHLQYGSLGVVKEILGIFELEWIKEDPKIMMLWNMLKDCLNFNNNFHNF